jgi:hypothetical protein
MSQEKTFKEMMAETSSAWWKDTNLQIQAWNSKQSKVKENYSLHSHTAESQRWRANLDSTHKKAVI